jgi:hypothetical protein
MFGGGALVAGKVMADRDAVTPATHAPALPTPQPTVASPDPSASTAAALPTQAPRVRPDEGTDVQDLTWISTESGWALGFLLDCTGTATDNSSGHSCYPVLHTTDGGRTWDKVATLPEVNAGGCCGVEIRFASKRDGFIVINGHLLTSSDGGRTWLPTTQTGVRAVEAARSGAVLLTNAVADDALCSPCRVLHAQLGSGRWSKTLELAGGTAALRRSGDTVLVASFANPAGGADNKSAQVRRSLDGGLTWTSEPDPCAAVHIQGHYVPFATSFEIAGPAELVSCSSYTFDMGTHNFILVSPGDGSGFSDWRDTPCSYSRYALGSGTTIACPALDGVHVSRDGGSTWRLTLPAGGQAGADGCGFQTPDVGRCARGSTVYTTRDAGRTWSSRDVSAS